MNNRIPTLDGWRGIAIALVLFDHIQEARLRERVPAWMETGPLGVTIFFVLSGFLITSKLLEGPIDLKRFYIRRFFRLMPAAWIYLATIFVLWRFVGIKITSYADLVAGLFFYRNLSGGTGAAVHFWSLSLEEQFYLVWPPILLLTCLRRSVWIALAGVCGVAAWRFSHWSAYDRFPFYLRTEVRADAILLGCLLAMLLSNQRIRAFAIRWSRLWAIPAFAVLVFSIVRSNPLPTLYEGVAIMGLIATTTLHSGSVLVKPLLFAPLVWLGTVSYSIYIWQQFFVSFNGTYLPFALCTGLPLAVLGSYYYIEQPCTRLGHRLTTNRRPGIWAH
ncbi:MAG: acyltransferase [Terracidiphilus sp.]|jgi:peptidoglycan/LPS O-acetylase OafA/YrhL